MKIKSSLLAGNKIRIMLHILAWTILLCLPLYFIKRWHVGRDFIWLYYINNAISGCVFYINYLVLVPKFFFDRKRFKYYIAVVLLIAGFYFISDSSNKLVFQYNSEQRMMERPQVSALHDEKAPGPGDRRFGRPPFRQIHLFNYTFTSLFLIFFSLGLRMIESHDQIEKRQKELEKEKLNSELAFLKNQISPHFFFNTLNNIYSLIGINAQDSQNAILKLSKLMRYLLYESDQGLTQLSSEIDFINNYIDLMRLRMSEKIDLRVDLPVKYENVNIPPLLFIPFIENAFKFGISYREKSFIHIAITVDNEMITFVCVNSIVGYAEDSAVKSGIGLENAGKRLRLLYPGKHELKIDRLKESFEVLLTIKTTNT
jgi:two-component system, LytTR family, sensor kinase